jgi:hypothetical protein
MWIKDYPVKQVSVKDIMQLAKLGYMRVDEVSYGVNLSLGQGMFPK